MHKNQSGGQLAGAEAERVREDVRERGYSRGNDAFGICLAKILRFLSQGEAEELLAGIL